MVKKGNPSRVEGKKRSGGTKRAITIEKITNKQALSVALSKRTYGIYSKASQLCLLDGSQIAILAKRVSADSTVSFHTFANSSVDAIISAYISGQPLGLVPPETEKEMREEVAVCLSRKDLGLGFWWEDDSPRTRDELLDDLESMRKVMFGLEELRVAVSVCNQTQIDGHKRKKNKQICSPYETQHPIQNQTLDFASTASSVVSDQLITSDSSSVLPEDQNWDELINSDTTLECLLSDDYPTQQTCVPHETQHPIQNQNASCSVLPEDQNLDDLDQLIDSNTTLECLLSDDYYPTEQDQNLDELIEYDTTFESLVSDGFFKRFDEDFGEFHESFLMDY